MAEQNFWEPTIKVLEGIFKKPKMSDKLLQKPPFKYLFDIVIATMEATHFGDGLFTPAELDINYYDNRDLKIMFLRKVLDLTQFAIGKGLAAKSNKIVAGLEPENTNIFLQEYGRSAITPDLAKKGPKIIKKLLAKYEEESKAAGGESNAAEKPPQQKDEPKPVEKKSEKPSEQPPPAQKPSRGSVAAAGSVDEPVAVVKQNARPSSALKQPPKIQSGLVKVQDNPRQGQGRSTTGVISDKAGSNDNDEDQTGPASAQPTGYSQSAATGKGNSKFTSEALNDALVPQASAQNNNEQDDGEPKRGAGIKMSLKGKKSSTTSAGASGAGLSAASTAGSSGTSGSASTDIAGLTLLVQEIAKNANPLGKSLEFIQDDIESMNHELDYWTKQYKASKEKMQQELKVTDELIQPLHDQIAEIDEQISDQKNKLANMKAQLIKNDSQIQSLLYSVVSSK